MLPPTFRTSLLRVPLRTPAHRNTLALARRNYSAEASKNLQSNFVKEREATKAHAAATSELWRKLSIYVAIPALIVSSINAWQLWNEHWEHVAHDIPIEEKPEYPYQNIRVKNYCWGDGDKTLFWNDSVNYHKKDE